MVAVSAAAAACPPRPLARASPRSRPVVRSRRATDDRARREDNPNFDPNDPMTWGTTQGDDDAFTDMGIPDEDLMQLATSSSVSSSARRARRFP